MTLIGLACALVLVLGIEALAVRRDDGSTISEWCWRLLSHPRVCLWLGLAIGVLLGHLFWPSDRVMRDLACEDRGGAMVCQGGR